MPRVVVKGKNVEEAVGVCPVSAIKRNPDNINEFAIDQSSCIDCGVCQSVMADGEIVELDEAKPDDVKFNEENGSKW